MKVLSTVLLFGLMVTFSEAKGYDAMRTLPGLNALSGLSGIIAKGPAAVAKSFGVDVHAIVNALEYWIKVLEPQLEPAALKLKIRKLAEILSKIPKAIGVAIKTDFLKLANELEDRIVSGAQLLLSVAKMILSALKTLKL